MRLPGYPIRGVVEVWLNGAAMPTDAYRVDGGRQLTRVDGGAWPLCQDLTKGDHDPLAFSVTYDYGQVPPLLGREAATELAVEMAKARTGGDCKLPSGAIDVTRQGIRYSRSLAEQLRMQGRASGGGTTNAEVRTGLRTVDLFIATYNRTNLSRPPSVWSPDTQPYGERLG